MTSTGLDGEDDSLFPDLLPAFSRGTSSPLFGKRTVPVKTLLTDEVAEALRTHAVDLGYTSIGDYLRDLIEVTLYGPEHLASLRRQQLDRLVRNRDGIDPQGAKPDGHA